MGVKIGGLLGFSILREYSIDIDYRNGLIVLRYDTQHRYTTREFEPVN